jgi:hypothetical protein
MGIYWNSQRTARFLTLGQWPEPWHDPMVDAYAATLDDTFCIPAFF